jgi:hypothetical protein
MDDKTLCGCAICGGNHLYGVDVDPEKNVAGIYRMEALRAASRIVGDMMLATKESYGTTIETRNAIEVAEQFAKYLEAGDV